MLLSMVLCVCVFALCVLTVLASVRDPAYIAGRHLFGTQRLLEHGHQNLWHLLEAFVYLRRTSECPAFIRGLRLFETRQKTSRHLLEVLQ